MVRQVHKYGSEIMIHIHELEFLERQVHKYGSKVMIHTHELEVFGHTSLQEWITHFDPHSWTLTFSADKFTSMDQKLWSIFKN